MNSNVLARLFLAASLAPASAASLGAAEFFYNAAVPEYA
jgi:hypothetical protein